MEEIWKRINITNGKYEISNNGDVRNSKKKNILKQNLNSCGYKYVGIRINGNKNKTMFFIHRLLALYFIENPNNLPCVNHIDGNKQNNNINNLEFCSQSYNINHAVKIGLIKTKKVNQYDKDNNFIKTWNSINDAQKYYSNYHINECCKKRRKTAGGYIWKYAD
jgi:hypothetical protein